jgi:ABC-type nickel/cobalt efflux system permease component RcnA
VVELNIFWAVAAIFVALFTAMFAALPPGVFTAAAIVLGAAIAILFLARLMSETARVDERRRAAVAWLHAFEDGIRAERRSALGR